MKQKLNVTHPPRSYRRLEVFRRICPDVPEYSSSLLFDEIDPNLIFFQEAMENVENRNGTVERQAEFIPAESSLNLSRELSTHVNNGSLTFDYIPNGNVGSTIQQKYDIVDRELSDALMHLQISGQNSRSGFNQGFPIIQTPPEETIWNSNHLMNTLYCSVMLLKNINKEIFMESLRLQTHLLPRDLTNEANYFPPINRGNNQCSIWDRQTQFVAEQHTTTPLNVYASEFVVPSSESSCMNTINLPQSTLQDMNFSNEFFQENNTYQAQPPLLDHNFLNEFYELTSDINHPQATLQHNINFPNEFNELNNIINQSQPVLPDCVNQPYEFYEQREAINQSQPIFLDGTNLLNECSEARFMNDNCWQPSPLDQMNSFNGYSDPRYTDMSIPQPRFLDYTNWFNGFPEPGLVNLPESTLTSFLNSNEFLNPNFDNPINFSQPIEFDYMNFNNECLGQSTMDFQQPNGLSYMNFSTPYISNPLENNFPDCMNAIGENSFLYGITPRPILNRNYLDEYQTPDLLQNSTAHDTNSTEDYTTEYSMTHAIARPTMNDHISPHISQNPVMDELQYPLRRTNSRAECSSTPSVPRPILNRSYLDEFPKSEDPQDSLNEFPEPYISQNLENYSSYPCTEFLNLLSVPRPILNRSGVNGFSMPYISQNSELDQTNPVPNYTNPYAEFFTSDTPSYNDDPKSHSTSMSDQIFQINYHTEFPPIQKAPKPDLNHVNGFPKVDIPQDYAMASTMVQMNVEPTYTNSEASQVSELSELSPNDE